MSLQNAGYTSDLWDSGQLWEWFPHFAVSGNIPATVLLPFSLSVTPVKSHLDFWKTLIHNSYWPITNNMHKIGLPPQ